MFFSKFVYFFFLTYGSLTIGYLLRRKGIKEEVSKKIFVFNLLTIEPIVTCLAFWRLNLSQTKIFTLPLAGLLLALSASIPAYFILSSFKDKKRQGSFLISSLLSNWGYIGGVICLLFLGEDAYALSVLYGILFPLFIYTVLFSLASHYGKGVRFTPFQVVKDLFREKIRLFPFLGIVFGLTLNLKGVKLPSCSHLLFTVFVPLGAFISTLGIGLTFHLSPVRNYKREISLLSLIRFLYLPLVGLLLSFLFGYRSIPGHLPMKVLFIQSFMPPAVMSVVIANIFNLDKNLSNSLWLSLTILFLPLLPFIILIARLL